MEGGENFEEGLANRTAGEGSVSGGAVPERTGGVVTARGTGEGLVIRLDGRVDPESLKIALSDFLVSRESFLAGNDIVLEWVDRIPSETVIKQLQDLVLKPLGITVKASRLKGAVPDRLDLDPDEAALRRVELQNIEGNSLENRKNVSLFGGIDGMDLAGETEVPDFDHERRGNSSADTGLWDDPDARVIYATLRSGQKLESEHSLIVCGDVNSGAEIVAGGDIVVLGILRGVAHAGAYDETGGGRFIFALNLQPTQLRIGSVISRGSTEGGRQPEIARVDGTVIVVEPYQSRSPIQARSVVKSKGTRRPLRKVAGE